MKQCFLLIDPEGYKPVNIDEWFWHEKWECVWVEYEDDKGVWHHQWMDARSFTADGKKKYKDTWYKGKDKCCIDNYIRVPVGGKVPYIK